MALWLGSRAKISTGAVFRGIDRWGRLASTALSPQAVNLILKKRARLAGLDAIELSAHGLQSGYLSETGRRGIPLVEAMQQSQHRLVQQAASDDSNANWDERRGSLERRRVRRNGRWRPWDVRAG